MVVFVEEPVGIVGNVGTTKLGFIVIVIGQCAVGVQAGVWAAKKILRGVTRARQSPRDR